jgi:hypothetical protein
MCSVNVRQRRFGSTPRRRTTSRSTSGRRAWKKALSGQSIWRVSPSTSETCGRVSWKSKNSSGSMSAKRAASQWRAR